MLPLNTHGRCLGMGILSCSSFGEERKMGVQGKCFWRRTRGQSNKMKRTLNAFSGHADRLSSVQ